MRVLSSWGAVALLLAASVANATLLSYDGFDYTGTVINGQSGGTGWGAAWVNTTGNPSLSNDGVSLNSPAFPFAAVGSRVIRTGPSTAGEGRAIRNLSQTISMSSNSVLYSSILIRRGSDGAATSASDMQIQFRTSTNGIAFRYGINSADQFIAGGAGGTVAGPAVQAGTVYFLIAKCVISSSGPDQSFLKVYGPNDTVPVTEPTTWDASYSESSSLTIAHVGINVGANNSSGEYDELRVGTDWSSVAPEPASLALCLAGALALVRRR